MRYTRTWRRWRLAAPAVLLLAAGTTGATGAETDAREASLRRWLEPQVAAAAAREGFTRYEISVQPLDLAQAAPALVACTRLEPFLPAPARAWGRVAIGLRCLEGARGVAMAAAQVQVWALVPVASAALAAGTVLEDRHLQTQEAELTREPAGADRRPAALAGRTLMRSVAAGQALRADMTRPTWTMQPGDPVTLRIAASGFEISAPGQALHAAAAGQAVRVRAENGRILSGVARDARIVDVTP